MSGNTKRAPVISARHCTAALCRCELCGTPGPYDPTPRNWTPRDPLTAARNRWKKSGEKLPMVHGAD